MKGKIEPLPVLGDRLRQLREGYGLSQNRLGKMIGLPQASIYRYEHAESVPAPRTLLWYADYFDVSLDYIYGRTDAPQGRLYDYKIQGTSESPELEKFVEMCFDPTTRLNEQLRATLLKMLGEEVNK